MSELQIWRAENEYIIRWNYIDYIVGIRDLFTQPGLKAGQRCGEDRQPV